MVQKTATAESTSHTQLDTSIGKIFLEANRRFSPSRVVLRHKRYGIWNEYTWAEHFQRTKDFALGLMSMGFQRGDKVAAMGDAMPETYWGMHGIWCAGGAMVAVHVDALAEEAQYNIDFADASFVFAKDQEQVDKLLRIKDQLPKVKRVIWWDPRGMHGYDDPWLTNFVAVSELGKAYGKDHPNAFEERIAESRSDDIAGVWYTSGTTGRPKAACHTHSSLLYATKFTQEIVHSAPDDDVVIFYGVGTTAECQFGSWAMLTHSVRVNLPETHDTYQQDAREIAPNYLVSVPVQWEAMISTIQVAVSQADFLKRFLYNQFLSVGYKYAACKYQGKQPGPVLSALHFLGDLLVLRPVRDRVGMSRLKIGLNSGFTLGDQTFMFLRALGLDIRQSYGSTEMGAPVGHIDGEIRPDSVGVPLPGAEFSLTPEGELLCKAPSVFKEYYKNPEATEKAFVGGWYRSGDAGYIDERKHIFVYGRMSQMGELGNGVKYSPQYIEAQLRFGTHIHDACVIGNQRNDFVTAVITLDYPAATRWAENQHLMYTTLVDLSQKDEIGKLVLKDVQRVNKTLPKESRIRRFVVLHKEFDADEGELTRTRKVKRNVVESKYADMIEAMYAGKDEVKVTAQVTYQDGRTGTVSAAVKLRSVPVEE